MMRSWRYAATALALSLPLLTCPAAAREQKGPPFPKVALVPFVIEAQPFEGAPRRADEDKILRELSEQATKQAERVLLRKGIAGAVERVTTVDAAVGKVTVTGTVRLPVSLPPNVIGWTASSRRGTFATGKVTIQNAEGKIIAEQEVEVPWRDGWWIVGGRARRNARLDNVLPDMARKAADRPLQRLARQSLVVRSSGDKP